MVVITSKTFLKVAEPAIKNLSIVVFSVFVLGREKKLGKRGKHKMFRNFINQLKDANKTLELRNGEKKRE